MHVARFQTTLWQELFKSSNVLACHGMCLFYAKWLCLWLFVFYHFKLNDHVLSFMWPNKHTFLKEWHYEMVTSKVLFLTTHGMFLSKLFCMFEDFKPHFNKNYLNYLLFFMLWHSFVSCKTDRACNYFCFAILSW